MKAIEKYKMLYSDHIISPVNFLELFTDLITNENFTNPKMEQ